jgi:CheY-like chemotaxis protein
MNDDRVNPAPGKTSTATASELNNLLEIISSSSSVIENTWEGSADSQKYFDMLRSSLQRAAQVTSQLAEEAGGTAQEASLHPELIEMPPRKTKASAPKKKRHLLVVDDEPMALVLAKRIMTEAGFEVTTAESGFACLDIFRKQPHQFDLILLDLSMPFMDGEETFIRLRNINPGVVVLLSTGFMAQERLDRMVAAGMAGFLRKPHRPDEVIAHIRAVLESVKMSRAGCAVDTLAAS